MADSLAAKSSVEWMSLFRTLAAMKQRRSQEFDLGGYKLHDIEFVLGQKDKTTT